MSYILDYVCHSGLPMMMLRILSYSLTFSIFLSMARWLVSSFFTNAFVTDHVWHPYIIAGKTHWLKTFLFRLMRRCLLREISLYSPQTLHPAFILIGISCLGLFSSDHQQQRTLETDQATTSRRGDSPKTLEMNWKHHPNSSDLCHT